MTYILITPAKNEEKSLYNLIESVASQSIKPALWVIVNDGSTDKTPSIIKETELKYNWIKSVQLDESIRDLGIHYAYICRKGFDFGIRYCKINSIQYEYIGLLDADMVLCTDYFNRLIKEFEKNSKLCIASGGIYYIDNKFNEIWEKGRDDLPRGGARIWRRKCFKKTGGYLLTYSPDSVSNIKAKLMGWETKQFKEIKAIQTRMTSSAEGFWKGYEMKGVSSYFVNTNSLLVMLKGIKYLFKKPYYIGIAYLWGYITSLIRREKRIDDEEIRHYYKYMRPKELVDYYIKKIKKTK
jgi:glycosyltransferase involved in cell wall biosynthesis